MNISYPTKEKVEKFLNDIFHKTDIILNGPDNKLWTIAEAYSKDKKDQYGQLDLGIKEKKISGIDIPILLGDGNSYEEKPIVAIVAQDPYRNAKDKLFDKVDKSKTIIGTPFAFHYKREAYPKTKVYRKIVDGLLEDGYKVYITDAHKIYSEDKTFSIDKDSEMNLLKDEIKEMNPKCVVTFGEDALNYIEDAYKKDEKKPLCVNVLHPSSNNTSNWDSWIFEQAYWEVKNKCEGFWSKYAQGRGNRDKVYGKFSGEMSVEKVIVESTMEKIKKILENSHM